MSVYGEIIERFMPQQVKSYLDLWLIKREQIRRSDR